MYVWSRANSVIMVLYVHVTRTGGNGTAGMAMAVPVFEEEKWRRLDSNLRYRMSSQSASP